MKVSEAYDLYLMDVHMPVKDGFEACREIRKMEGNKTRTPHSVYRIAGGRCMGVDSEAGIDDYPHHTV
jgi:CheY-like chemotaxis protein